MSDRKLMSQVLDDLCGARLCSVNSMSSRREAERLIDRAITHLRERLAQCDRCGKPLGEPGHIHTCTPQLQEGEA